MTDLSIRRAGPDDAPVVARLLHDFNTEFDDPSPGVEFLTDRVAELLGDAEIAVFLAGEGADGLAVVRLRPALWSAGLEAYLEELYVVPKLRGRGIGRALLDAVVEFARESGADRIDLGTSEDDTAARALYESAGFTNRDKETGGSQMLFYEQDL